MNKQTAKQYDNLLREIAKKPRSSWHISHIKSKAVTFSINPEEVQNAIATFVNDDFLKIIEVHEGVGDHFQIYSITPRGISFIMHEGGYLKKRRFENYEFTNKRFTWIRHWVWFFGFVLSFLANIYFIVTYLLKSL